jgi:hypothetical protein
MGLWDGNAQKILVWLSWQRRRYMCGIDFGKKQQWEIVVDKSLMRETEGSVVIWFSESEHPLLRRSLKI